MALYKNYLKLLFFFNNLVINNYLFILLIIICAMNKPCYDLRPCSHLLTSINYHFITFMKITIILIDNYKLMLDLQ